MKRLKIPKKGLGKEEILARLKSFKSNDAEWHEGRMFGLIYYAGEDVEEVVREAYATYMFENALSPFAFPSLLKMETEFISMISDLWGGDEDTVGSMTSGGTESIFMAVKAAREWAKVTYPHIKTPEIVAPITIHPAWNKAADYLGLKIILTPVDEDWRANTQNMAKAITENTIMLGCSAVTYPHGMIDPVEEIGALAEERNLWFHVDACLGGYILPFLKMSGYALPAFDFSIPGVKSISVDIHKYGYVSKGASTVLYRAKEWREYQFYIYTEWPGGIYATPCLSGARPGGAIAASWAILHYLGEEGFKKLAQKARETTIKMIQGINQIPGLYVLGNPPATVFAFGSREFNIYKVAEKLKERGWHIDAQHRPPSLHMTISPIHEKIVEIFLKDLKEVVKEISSQIKEEVSGIAALYGLMNTLPDKRMARDFALKFLNDLYKLK